MIIETQHLRQLQTQVMNDLELAQSIVKRCQDGGYGLVITEAGTPTLTAPKPDLDPALLTDMAMCPPQALRAVLIGLSVIEALPTEQPALLEVPATLPPATAWSGGVHDGSRLTEDEKFVVRTLWADGLSLREIAKQTKHGRNTIEALISNPAYAEELKLTRAHRALVREEILSREQMDVIMEKRDDGKASIADLTNARMVESIVIKEAGGAAPTRIIVEADQTFLQAAALFGAAAPHSPVRPVQEAEIVPNPTLDLPAE
jgi:hypothetical protein